MEPFAFPVWMKLSRCRFCNAEAAKISEVQVQTMLKPVQFSTDAVAMQMESLDKGQIIPG